MELRVGEILKKYDKPKLKEHGNLKKITKKVFGYEDAEGDSSF